MKKFAETHRSFVNTWECDENAHMNVQFYLHRFDEAARIYSVQNGAKGADYCLPVTRHVRYHRELAAGTATVIRTAAIKEGPLIGHIVHLLEEAESGKLSATALDAPNPGENGFGVDPQIVAKALPRSFEASPSHPKRRDEMLKIGGFRASQTVVHPGECDAGGELLERAIVSRFTDAAPHVWSHAGFGTDWLASKGYGRIAVEMKITHHKSPRAGTILMMHSAAWTKSGKIVHLRHELADAITNEPYVTGEVAALIMDLNTRKSVRLPKDPALAR